ncbi:aminopeptidase N [Streptomyces lunaelactis]|uniref:aminopeptidase N n=3 Tax=Streptomyces lunaelactis TaxID=1535768 RepID=UPI0015855893|nr:aminopeptidase N [Streptomyces lunaelactis]NUK01137.1 aminopeptidase N [Streptomyces lunaelactis]NUK07891.1 aminopeptidase N [Streptomyces lunaelactis]NUK16682.1 aminopeptidase N [Streptomyces lunaelactis]NUK49772.1 aminopeptidase N [Streptomyces lunaelactis]NUK66823.1 aminopeptidase N [Streptomyces lunaelactis]
MSVLTRDEAQTRAQLLDVHRYTIDLDLTTGEETFDSRTVIHFTAHAAGDTFVELKPAVLRSITLDGHPIDPETLAENRLALTGLSAGEHELRVEADMRYSRTGEGMHRFTDPTDGEAYVYTQLFMEDVQRVFAAFDQPDLKAVFEVSVTAPDGWTVLGNGIATHTGEGRWTCAPTPPLATYFVAVTAGPWHSVRTEHAGLPFGLHCRRSLAPYLDADADEILEITRQCYDRYHEKFEEPYPFDSYDQAFVPEFNAGAMENPGLVTFRDEFIYRSAVTDTERQTRAMVIAHEMAHMWFGDLVTLKWWDDIWLNESFAEYMGYQTLTEATRFTDTWVDFGIGRKSWGYDADQRPSTHPVAPDPDAVPDTASAMLNFDGISYAKGASALRQLVAWLGEKDFLAGINTHFARHKFGNATLADFIDSLAGATDRDVHGWAESWLRTTGVDTLTPAIAESDSGGWSLTVARDGSRPHRILVGAYDADPIDADRLVLRDRVELDIPQSENGARPGRRPALVVLNDGDLGYAKVRLDATSWNTAVRALSGIPDPLTRTVVWNAARDMVRDGELAPAAYLEAARAHLPRESDLAVVQGVLAFAATQLADRYLTAEQRPAALGTLREICRALLRRTEDGNGPGLRLTAVRHFIDAAAQPDTLQQWLGDGSVPGGPELDPELRWRILYRLAVLGATDDAAIAAELHRDPSATGQEGAARCHAALPTPEAKAAAWERLFTSDGLSNYLFTATAQGFWQPEQADLVREYVPRYYPHSVALAARRGPVIAEAAGRYAFPLHAVDAETLRLGEECLRDADMIPALRRKLVDQLDDLRRALTVRGA